MSRELLLDLGFLTEEERDIINSVISKDVQIRKQEQSRIGDLREQLDELRENGLPEEEIEAKNNRYCARCQTYFGTILNRGAVCPKCNLKVCKGCRKDVIDDGWMCILCSKVRDVKAQSGAWFFQSHKQKNGNLFGSLLVRKSLRKLPTSPEERRVESHQPLSNTNYHNDDNDDQTLQYNDDMDKSLDEDTRKPVNTSHYHIGLSGEQNVTYSDSDEASRDDYHSVVSSERSPYKEGDDGRHRDPARPDVQNTTPIIVAPANSNDNNAPRSTNSSIIEYEEDLDVSFSKFGMGLGNKKMKDQLSMGSRESIVSYYSNAGGEVYGKYPVTGEIYFGMKYDAKVEEFHVQIHQAREITAVDEKNRASDPYVKTYLLPDRTRGGKRKTKIKKHTINPVFDEIVSYKISYDEIIHRTLWVAVWNHDRFGHNDFLGEVLIPIDEYQQSGFSLEDPEPQWYHLCERQAEDPDFSYGGEIVFAMKYVPPSSVVSKKKKKKKKEEKGELHINIIEASNLPAKDANGFSDPFCKSYLLPDKSKKTKQKTAVVKKNLNPKWNYQFIYDNVTHEELMDRVLELTVWDFDRGSSNDFLGGVRLGLGAGLQEWDDANSEEQAAWNKMLNNHNNWNQVTVTLRDHMGNANSLQGSFADMSHTVDSYLMEIQPDQGNQFPCDGKSAASPDDELLIRHSEYHRPHDSRIVAATKASDARLSEKVEEKEKTEKIAKSSGKKKTLAELAKLGIEGGGNKSYPRSSTLRTKTPPDITVEMSPGNNESLVRHSEFYKASKTQNIARRRSNESISSGSLQERRPTLVDILEQNKDDKDNVNEDRVGPDLLGSVDSIYSINGIYSNNTVSGEIFIGYQYLNGTLKIKIFEARGLTAIDKTKNTSDPYAKVYLLPDQSRAGKRKTKVKPSTLDPEFNEEMLYKIGTRELLTRTILLSLWNNDRFGRNEFLGELRLPLHEYKGKEVAAKWYTLSEMQRDTSDNPGELVVALMYSPADEKKKKKQTNTGKLHVHIVEAKNLAGKDSNNLSDPFCKSYLLPDQSKKTKNKTPVMKRNLNPHWNYKFTYDNVSLKDLETRVLELTVWDHDLGTSNDFLGGVRIGLGTGIEPWDDSQGEEVTLWQFLLSKPNTWTQSILPLRNEMATRTS